MSQQDKADRFRMMHERDGVFVLPNAWDAASARILEEVGYPAIGTTSAGIAFSLGYPDGEHVPPSEMVAVIGRIARTVRIPVTADIERGYGDTPEAVALMAEAVFDAGAIGVNIEDASDAGGGALIETAAMCEKIAAARAAGEGRGVHLVINARTDGFYDRTRGPGDIFDDAVARANAYLSAGADCAFVPAVTDRETIERLVAAIDGPLNVVVPGPGMPGLRALEAAGVRRVSLGGCLMRSMAGLLRFSARQVLNEGSFEFADVAIPHDEMDALFAREGT